MRTVYIFLLIAIIALVGAGYFVTRDMEEDMRLEVEFIPEDGIESQEIRVLNEEGDIVFQLTIDELNQWTEENWHVFEEKPEVGGREVDPTGFGFFDRAVSVSNDNRKMVFSVSDYAVASTTSFVIVVDIDSGEMEMVRDPSPGSVEDYFWSKDNDLVAYTVGTGRARGDFLLVDDVVNLERRFMLDERDILEALESDEEAGQFMPVFQYLKWSEERLYFTTEHPGNDQVRWSIDKEGEGLQKEDHKAYRSLSLGVFFEYPSSAFVDYEEERIKVTYVGEDSHMTQITDGFTFFVDVVDKEERSLESIAEEEFEERTQEVDPIADPSRAEVNGKSALTFKIEGGLNGEHVFFLFEDNNKVVITSHFIADPEDKGYDQKVRDILLSIEVE